MGGWYGRVWWWLKTNASFVRGTMGWKESKAGTIEPLKLVVRLPRIRLIISRHQSGRLLRQVCCRIREAVRLSITALYVGIKSLFGCVELNARMYTLQTMTTIATILLYGYYEFIIMRSKVTKIHNMLLYDTVLVGNRYIRHMVYFGSSSGKSVH